MCWCPVSFDLRCLRYTLSNILKSIQQGQNFSVPSTRLSVLHEKEDKIHLSPLLLRHPHIYGIHTIISLSLQHWLRFNVDGLKPEGEKCCNLGLQFWCQLWSPEPCTDQTSATPLKYFLVLLWLLNLLFILTSFSCNGTFMQTTQRKRI